MVRAGAIILAAGGSRRLGQAKQCIRFRGESLVRRAVRAAQEGGCRLVVVVTGESHEPVAAEVANLQPQIVRNANWSRGIGSSIQVGVEELLRHDFDAVVLLTCDQPAVDAEVVRALIAEHERSHCPIVAAHYAETLGIPALFHRSFCDELRSLPHEQGAKTLIQKNLSRVGQIDFEEGALDVDTEEDLRPWQNR